MSQRMDTTPAGPTLLAGVDFGHDVITSLHFVRAGCALKQVLLRANQNTRTSHPQGPFVRFRCTSRINTHILNSCYSLVMIVVPDNEQDLPSKGGVSIIVRGRL